MIVDGVEASLGERLKSARPMGGGCIGEVYRVELDDGPPLVAKVDREGESHLEREAYMLRYLREKSELPVPEVYHGSQRLLLMQFIEGSSRFTKGAERHAAELLAGAARYHGGFVRPRAGHADRRPRPAEPAHEELGRVLP